MWKILKFYVAFLPNFIIMLLMTKQYIEQQEREVRFLLTEACKDALLVLTAPETSMRHQPIAKANLIHKIESAIKTARDYQKMKRKNLVLEDV